VIPIVLVLALLAILVFMKGVTGSLLFRAFGVSVIFALGLGAGLGIGALKRGRSPGQHAAWLPAVAGITLNTLVFIAMTLLVLRGASAARDPGMVEDVREQDRPLQVP
jgi:hypothetical protein